MSGMTLEDILNAPEPTYTVNRATVQGAFDILDALKVHGYDAIIAGGFARDAYFGKPPKDIDIVVPVGDRAPALIGGISTAYTAVGDLIKHLGYEVVSFRMYNGLEDRIVGGFKIVGANIDVCVYDAVDADQAVNSFDFNINQFVIANTRDGIDGATIRYRGLNHWRDLEPVRRDYTRDRHNLVMSKYIDLVTRVSDDHPLEVPLGGTDGPF